MDRSRIDILQSMPVKQAILKLALPTMFAMAMQLIYNLTDMFFIGRTGDPYLVAAVSLVGPLMIVFQAIGGIFAIGSASYISRKLGEKQYEEVKHASSVAAYTAAACGVLLMVTLLVFKQGILDIIGTSSMTYQATDEYLTILGGFAVFAVLQVAFSGLIRSEGATNKAMIGMVLGIAINIMLDPIFILVLDMGAAGAAWATIIGQIVGSVYFLIHLLGGKTMLSLKLKDFRPNKIMYAESFKIGVPSALGSLVMSFSFVLANVIAATYGDYVVAGNGIEMRVGSMAFMMVMGLAQGYQPFAGYNYGAKNYKRLMSGFKTTMLYGTIVSIFFSVIFLLFGREMFRMFIDDTKTVDAGMAILNAFLWTIPLFGVQITLMITFQATGKAMKSFILLIGRQALLFLPLLFILNAMFGFKGYIYAQPVSEALTTVIAVLMSISFVKELHCKEKEALQQVILEQPVFAE